MFTLIISSFYTAVPVSKASADNGSSRFEAEDAVLMEASVETLGGISETVNYSGSGVVDLKSESSSVTWETVSASVYANYTLNIKYSSSSAGTAENPQSVNLNVNGQPVASFKTEQTGTDTNPVWKDLTAIVTLNKGSNIIKLTSVSADGPYIDYLDVTPYSILIEGETGHGITHVNNSLGSNAAVAQGYSGTGYVIIPTGKTPPAYLLWDNITVPKAGSYTLKFRYNNADTNARPVTLKVNDAEVLGFNGASTGAWSNWRFQDIKNVALSAGTNAIKLEPKLTADGKTAPMPNIDRIEIYPETVPVIGDQTFRTTTFDTDDVDPSIASTAVGAELQTPLLNGKAIDPLSDTAVTLVEHNGSRMAQVTIPELKPGAIGFPFHQSWTTPVAMNSYTIETSLMLKDENANYLFDLVDGSGSLNNAMLVFGMDGKLYARSDNTASGALSARVEWDTDTLYQLKLVCHVDTKSYDLYLNGTQIVMNEPMKEENYSSGLKAFYLQVKGGPHLGTSILIDNVQLSGSNQAGSLPVVNTNPGERYVETPYIGEPIQYYVSPTGSDSNNGLSAAAPFKNIQTAAALTNPGDTVHIMPGTYTANNTTYGSEWFKISRSGAKNIKTGELAPITYKAYDMNNKPKLKLADKVPGIWNMVDVRANYIVVDGLEVEGNNMNITLAEAEANYESKVAGGTDWSKYAMTNTNGISVAGHHITIKNTHVHDMAGMGIGGKGDYLLFDNNISHSNSWYTMYATSGMGVIDNVDFDQNTTDYKIIMSNNVIYDNETKVKWDRTKGYSDGNGIILDVDDGYKGKKLVVNNIVYNNGGGGIHAYRSNNVHVINNTIYHNSRSPHLNYPNMDAQASDNSVFLNNISIAREGDKEYANLNSGWNNLFANNIYGGNVRFLGQNDRVIDPKFVSVVEGSYDFRLMPDSPAIDNGTRTSAPSTDIEGQLRPFAGAGAHARVDIGAYETEYNSATPLADDSVQIKEPIPDQRLKANASRGTPVIDGQLDDAWSTTDSFQALKISDATKGAPVATMRLLWDEHNLYVLAEVKDANLSVKGANLWEHDSMEFFMDENNANSTVYQSDDGHYRVNYENLRTGGSRGKKITASSFSSEARVVDGGYIIESALPLTTITGSVGKIIGFDAGASDDSNFDGIRDNATMWSNQRFNSHDSTEWYGDITFVEGDERPSLTSIQPVEVSTTVGTAPTLPSVVTSVYSDGSTADANVVWDVIAPNSYASTGSFTVNGAVFGTELKAAAKVTVQAAEEGDGGPTPVPTPRQPVLEGSMIQVTPALAGHSAKAELSQELLDKLLAQTESDGNGMKNALIQVNSIAGAYSYALGLPAPLLRDGEGKNKLRIQTALATVTLPDNMLNGKDVAAASKAELQVAAADTTSWKQELRDKIGSKPVLELSILVDGKRIEWRNTKAPVTVAIDYKPTTEELKQPEHIAIWYIDGNGKIVKVPSGKYDAATGKITFTTTHFSQYAIGYELNSFQDLKGFNWAKEQIEVLVSKGIVNGTSGSTFAPRENITRADFLALLVRALDLEAETDSNFADVKSTDYFYEEIGIAKALGIAEGFGDNQFNPKLSITRQDMMVLAEKAMKAAGKALQAAEIADLSNFNDVDRLADYAAESVAALVNGGLIQGDGMNLRPHDHTSRAEVAVLVYRIYNQADK